MSSSVFSKLVREKIAEIQQQSPAGSIWDAAKPALKRFVTSHLPKMPFSSQPRELGQTSPGPSLPFNKTRSPFR